MRLVILESPFSGNVERNIRYARACIRDCLRRGEAPIASHLLFTQPGILRDEVPEERRLGLEAGWAWNARADAIVVYDDFGRSTGMVAGISDALSKRPDLPVEYRRLPPEAMEGL